MEYSYSSYSVQSQPRISSSISSSLGDLSLTIDSTGLKQYKCQFYDFPKENQFQMKQRISNNCDNLLKIQNYTFYPSETLTFSGEYLLEYYEKDLENELNSRKISSLHFSEQSIFEIAYSLISGLLSINKLGAYHGGICPKTIFNTNYGWKLADHSLITGEKNWLYKKCYSGDNNLNIFLSENLVNNIKQYRNSPIYEENDDLYSLGIVLILCTSLLDINEIYDKQNLKLKLEKTQISLENLKFIYSEQLISFILDLINPFNKSNIQTVKNKLDNIMGKSVYQSNIIKKETPLIFENLGNKNLYRSELFVKNNELNYNENDIFSYKTNENVKKGGLDSYSYKESSYQYEKPYLKSPNQRESIFSVGTVRSEFETFRTPDKNELYSRIHKVSPGSFGKNSIKISYTPTKITEEKLKKLDDEFRVSQDKIEQERKSTDRSMKVLKDTVDFLRSSNKKKEYLS